MSEVPELSKEAQAFLADHAQTGEPTAGELARAQASLELAAAAPVAKPGRRLPVPGEWLAVAAVLLALVAARGVFVLLHDAGASRQHVLDTYRAGDVEGALQRAKTECRGDECAGLETKLAKAASLSSRIGALTPAERDELGRLDAELAPGGTSAIALQLRSRESPSPKVPPEAVQALVDEARDLMKARNYESATIRLEKCVRVTPGRAECYRMLGSTYAKIAMRDGSDTDMEKARKAYERFLEVAPPDDEYVPKVREILEAAAQHEAGDSSPSTSALTEGGQLVVTLGGSGSIDTREDIQRVAIGDASVADVKVAGPRKLLIEGVEPGKTTLIFWGTSGARQIWLIEVRPK